MDSTIHIHLQFLFADEFLFLHISRTNTAIFLNLENTSDYEYLRHIQTMSRLAVRGLAYRVLINDDKVIKKRSMTILRLELEFRQ